jgi:hypothetical protein
MNLFFNNKAIQAFLISAIVIASPVITTGQAATVPPAGAPTFRSFSAFDDRLTITDQQGAPFANKYLDVDGSPYLIDHYCGATLKLNKGTVYKNTPVKINLHTHEVIVIDKNNKEIVPVDGLIVSITLFDTAGAGPFLYNFRSGYPPIDKKDTVSFYQVLSDGKLQLLKYTTKELVELKNAQSGEMRKEFTTRDDYYVYSNGEIKRLKKDKDSVEQLMKDQEQKIHDYQQGRKVNFKNISDLVRLFDYYNSLSTPSKGF